MRITITQVNTKEMHILRRNRVFGKWRGDLLRRASITVAHAVSARFGYSKGIKVDLTNLQNLTLLTLPNVPFLRKH